MFAEVLDKHIEITLGVAGGKPRIAGHRITVQNIVVWHEHLGQDLDVICTEHDLSLAAVHAALAFTLIIVKKWITALQKMKYL